MNCDMINSIARDLALGRPLEARERLAADSHVARCARCARRLAGERALTASLRALSAADSGAQASPAVESALMAAFRARSVERAGDAASVAEPVHPEPSRFGRVVALASDPSAGAHAFRAVAAAVLIALGLAVAALLVAPGDAPPQATAGAAPFVEPDAPQPLPVRAGSELPKATERAEVGSTGAIRRVKRVTPRARRAPQPDVVDKLIATTEFVPFAHGSTAGIPANGHVVRVSVPRSVLAAEGFPVNANREESVTADVLLADDGTARAIRFVGVADLR